MKKQYMIEEEWGGGSASDVVHDGMARSGTETDLQAGELEAAETDGADTTSHADGVEAQVEESKKRKSKWGEAKKSRWGNAQEEAMAGNATIDRTGDVTADEGGSGEGERGRTRRSRWSTETAAPAQLSQQQVQETLVLQMKLKQVNDRISTVSADAARREADPNRSPSPPPKYDAQGKRTNTREVRMKESLENERANIIESMMKLNPAFQVPEGYVKRKPSRKLYIPTKDYPGYNFIGLIIGPRGNTQKRMERESGCKIAIRGKGSVKEGARRTRATDEEDDLHVYITGDTEEQVEIAAVQVKELLTPVDDEKNAHKQKQLRELALINGTLRDDEYCHVCGEKGHRQFECPKRATIKGALEVRCLICGDNSHPTRDCSRRRAPPSATGAGGAAADPTKSAVLDKEYMSFMKELGGAPPAGASFVRQAGQTQTPSAAAGGGAVPPQSSPTAPASAAPALGTQQQLGRAASPPQTFSPYPAQMQAMQQQQQKVAAQAAQAQQAQATAAYYATYGYGQPQQSHAAAAAAAYGQQPQNAAAQQQYYMQYYAQQQAATQYQQAAMAASYGQQLGGMAMMQKYDDVCCCIVVIQNNNDDECVSLVEIESGVGSELGHVHIVGVFCQPSCGVVTLGVGIETWLWRGHYDGRLKGCCCYFSAA